MFMLEKAVTGSRKYWTWISALLLVILVAFYYYMRQFDYGLGLTGMGRNISWGLYIGQFTFMVGVAASAVMVVLPYYLHDHKEFHRMTILGELLAVASVVVCMLFIFVDIGQPMRILNVLLYPQFHSVMFWDMASLSGYLLLNIIITLAALHAEQKGLPVARWVRYVILLSIPWAVSIHTVTAFLYAGLPGRPFWLTAIMAPRFLASAFASGPALLILLCMLVRRLTGYDVGRKAIDALAVIITYAMAMNVFFLSLEIFTAYYSRIPDLTEDFNNLYLGIGPHSTLLPWGRASIVLMVISLGMLLLPRLRRNHVTLVVACVVTYLALWIDKGICLVVGGFMPSPFGFVSRYVPTFPEVMITVGVYAIGILMVTVLYKVTLAVKAADPTQFAYVPEDKHKATPAVGTLAATEVK